MCDLQHYKISMSDTSVDKKRKAFHTRVRSQEHRSETLNTET